MPSILFVCTANRFRSPLAALYFAKKVVQEGDDDTVRVSSAGTWTVSGEPAMTKAIRLGKTYDLNLSFHQSRLLTEDILASADLILVMEAGHKEAIVHEFPATKNKTLLLTEAVGFLPANIPDPYSTSEPPAQVAKEIIQLIDHGYQRIIDLARDKSQDQKPGV